MSLPQPWRKTTQHLMPARRQETAPGQYNIYPSLNLGPGRIEGGFGAGAALPVPGRSPDGYPGVIWADFRERLHTELTRWVARPLDRCQQQP